MGNAPQRSATPTASSISGQEILAQRQCNAMTNNKTPRKKDDLENARAGAIEEQDRRKNHLHDHHDHRHRFLFVCARLCARVLTGENLL